MWSYIQYSQIGRDVEQLMEKEGRTTRVQEDVESAREHCFPLVTQMSRENGHSAEKGHATEKVVIRVENDNDPLDSKNWPLASRCENIAIISFLIFSQGWAGAAESMANKIASAEFGVSQVAENLSTSMYLFGIGSGSALTPTSGGQVACRFFVGLFSSATLSVNGSSVRDQFRPVKRRMLRLLRWHRAGGWIVSSPNLSWRWTGWVILMISSIVFFLRRVTGDNRYVSEHADSASFTRRLRQVGPLPAKLLTQEPVIAVFSGYLTLLYVLLFIFLSGFDYIYKVTYQLSTAMTRSRFASIAAGATFFTLWSAIGDQKSVSIWSNLGACFVFGMVIIAIYVSNHAAVGLAGITIARYLVAGGMVMAARPMYEGIGTHWTMTLLGCIAVILLPAPLAFWWYGRKLRSRSPYAKSPSA
ncbi:MFS general substrate transporter [Annulohypoxylon truncatum]|uniref:MFS general substrate transporter n=1 Tax=Annulohypoxylon truncatum TaxID=327061 RepID=UPI002008299F|nr:MFS general substrate transporter [Annulohypoxylon truncatum]KAI1206193.1 MFS general substrate transporter [Annulohypoxylon truncatum]